MFLLVETPSAWGQPGCIAGDRILRNTRIVDAGNACNHCTNNPPDVLLHLLHSHTPTLKLTHNYSSSNCSTDVDGTLSLHYDGAPYSTLVGMYDFSLVSGPTAGDLILSTRNPEANILFGTTWHNPWTEVTAEEERMRITPIGHVGVAQTNPLELLHIGPRMTFHVGVQADYLGYNVYRYYEEIDNSPSPPTIINEDRLIVGTSGAGAGYPLKYGMSRTGYLEIGAGSTSGGLAGQAVDWYEGGDPLDAFGGLTIKQNNGQKACASFGKYYPSTTTRLQVRGFTDGETETDVFLALSSANAELFRVRNNGRVGIAQAAPKERLHIGDLITFHDGGGKFMGFNAYWNGTVMKNLEGGRASVTLGIGDGSVSPDVFAIQVDEQGSADATIFTGFKGMVINSDGDMGVGTMTPNARLHVLGDMIIGDEKCTTTVTGFNARLSVDGIIFAQEVVVTESDWADHVFSPEFKLMPISELKEYVEKHRHLPGIPTKYEVAEHGVRISEIQVKLLEKIEELTLYVMELAQQNVQLKEQLNMNREQLK